MSVLVPILSTVDEYRYSWLKRAKSTLQSATKIPLPHNLGDWNLADYEHRQQTITVCVQKILIKIAVVNAYAV